MKKNFLLFLSAWLSLGAGVSAYDIPGYTPDQIVEYKQTVNSSGAPVTLNLDVFTPPGHQVSDSRPAVVFFFGGGWNSGSSSHFHPHCEYLASRGMVAISAEYRVSNVHGTTPRECVKDGKSAVRYLRENAAALGIDPDRIAASGGSSGGHIAAAAGTLGNYEEAGENLGISSRPNALVLFNPVFDNGPTGYGYSRVQAYWEDISPLHNIDATAPPTVVYLGTNDRLIPVATAKNYKALMEAAGRRCDLHLYEDQPHSFFNFDVPDDASGPFYGYQATVFRMDEFLVSIGYLDDPYDAPTPVNDWVTISGAAGFSGGSEATSSPVTTDADGDVIAANFPPVSLADGEFIRLTGSVTLDVPLTGSNFRIGLFDGDDPVLAGDGTGYVGIWSEAPATSDTHIAAGDGSGSGSPFEIASAVILGPVPAAVATVAANTPIDFTLMIARNGNDLEISTNFTDNGTYNPSQNLLKQAVAEFSYDRVAFQMSGPQASFSDIEIVSGSVLPGLESVGVTNRVITYVDAVEGVNTFATGGSLATTAWVGPSASSSNDTQWNKRDTFGNDATIFQAMPNGSAAGIPELTTEITGLDNGTYNLWAFFWDQVENDTQNWTLAAGLTSGSLTTYSAPGEPSVSGATSIGVANAASLIFANTLPGIQVAEGRLRELFGANLGQVMVTDGTAKVHLDMLLNGSSGSSRTWYDGVGYARVNNFSDWISGFSVGDQTGFDDDPDEDGKKNGLENFFGTDPGVADAAGLRAVEVGTDHTITFTHPQSADPADDLIAHYEWSSDLDQFSGDGISNDAGTSVNFLAAADTPTLGTTTVTATLTGAVIPDRLFVRLSVLQPAP